MRHKTTVKTSFEASHLVEEHTLCGRDHGHLWQVAVTVEGGLHPKQHQVVDHHAFLRDLEMIVNEIRDRNLNDMLQGVITTPEGVALYFRERLVLWWPRIVEVEVQMGPSIVVRVESDIR